MFLRMFLVSQYLCVLHGILAGRMGPTTTPLGRLSGVDRPVDRCWSHLGQVSVLFLGRANLALDVSCTDAELAMSLR